MMMMIRMMMNMIRKQRSEGGTRKSDKQEKE